MNNDIVTWGVIGAGDVCEVKSVPAMYRTPGSRVKSVMRRNLDLARDFAERHNIPEYYNDAGKILNDPDIDIVYIATPPSSHASYALEVAAAGKAAYVEKPMAINHRECQEMVRAFHKASRPLFVAYYRRTLPNFLKIKEIIDSGTIGEVRMVNIRMNKTLIPDNVAKMENNWRVMPEISGGGYFYDLASHQLDFLDFLLGPVKSVSGITANQAGAYKAEDIVVGSFEFENGVLGTGSWCFSANEVSDLDLTTIIGGKGHIEYPTFGDSLVRLVTGEGTKDFRFDLPVHIQSLLVEEIVKELKGTGRSPSTGVSAARTNLVLESFFSG